MQKHERNVRQVQSHGYRSERLSGNRLHLEDKRMQREGEVAVSEN